MKDLNRMIALVFAFLLIISCNQDITLNNKGFLTISISDISKGFDSISMDTDHYEVTASREGFESVSITISDVNIATGRMELEAGSWNIVAVAYNQDGIAIGEGRATCNIVAGANTSCSIAVSEYEGEGTLSLTVNYTGSDQIKAYVLTSVEYLAGEDGSLISLTKTEAAYTGSISLVNGFYYICIKDDSGTVLSRNTLRIVKGQTVSITASIQSDSTVAITINGKIQSTPTVEIDLDSSYFYPGDKITASATIEGFEPVSYIWYLNSTLLENENDSSVVITLPENAMPGSNKITCICYDTASSVIWSDTVSFEIYEDGTNLTKIEVEGKVEFKLIGDVLLPEALVAKVMNGESTIHSLYMPCFNYVHTFEEKTNVDCIIEGVEDYSYYFESYEDNENDKTVIFIVVDKEIEDAAYLNISFTHKFVQKEGTSRGVSLLASKTIFPHENDRNKNKGFIPLNNEIKSRVIKVPQDSYRHDDNCGCNCNYAHLGVVSPNSFTVEKDTTTDIEIGSEPFARVELCLPESININNFSITLSDGLNYHSRHCDIIDGKVFIDLKVGEFEAILESNGELYSCELNLVEGSNTAVFEKFDEIVETAIELDKNERYLVEYEFKSLFPRNGYVFTRVGNDIMLKKELIAYAPHNPVYSTGGELTLCLPFMEEYCATAEKSQGVDSDGNPLTIITVVIDLPKDSDFATLNYQYDFEFDEEIHVSVPLLEHKNKRYCLPVGVECTSVKVFPGSYMNIGSIATGSFSNKHRSVSLSSDFSIEKGEAKTVTLVVL